MIKHLRVYRVLRVVLSVVRVFPRYLILNLRARLSPPGPSQAAWDRVHLAAAHEMRRIALSLAGAFTKAAQIWGARADIMPAPFIDTLSQFHDAVPPRPFESVGAARALIASDARAAIRSFRERIHEPAVDVVAPPAVELREESKLDAEPPKASCGPAPPRPSLEALVAAACSERRPRVWKAGPASSSAACCDWTTPPRWPAAR